MGCGASAGQKQQSRSPERDSFDAAEEKHQRESGQSSDAGQTEASKGRDDKYERGHSGLERSPAKADGSQHSPVPNASEGRRYSGLGARGSAANASNATGRRSQPATDDAVIATDGSQLQRTQQTVDSGVLGPALASPGESPKNAGPAPAAQPQDQAVDGQQRGDAPREPRPPQQPSATAYRRAEGSSAAQQPPTTPPHAAPAPAAAAAAAPAVPNTDMTPGEIQRVTRWIDEVRGSRHGALPLPDPWAVRDENAIRILEELEDAKRARAAERERQRREASLAEGASAAGTSSVAGTATERTDPTPNVSVNLGHEHRHHLIPEAQRPRADRSEQEGDAEG
eukprot:TRINITY_DN22601_c0_g1_i1.p1 TRINITY_DN22601_c0_g1~~TRINITY_DN22601_c0_g1_i1.p1  ORF type:complete len:340 (+),score=55.53 TRINITY_DN22601_c0_g1_i1:118-1137(+)